jgi:uncharacterized coiled-coil protein SlyX
VTTKEHKIMNESLPQIIDELQSSIDEVARLAKESQQSADDSRLAAAEAKASGVKASEAAKLAAQAAVTSIREEMNQQLAKVADSIDRIEARLDGFYDKMQKEASAIDNAILAAKERHVSESPFLD